MRVLIAAGGTAGHINPALAIAGALKKADPTAEIHFAGRKEGMEYRLVTQAGYPFHHIEITGFQRRLSLNNIKRNIITLWNLALSGPKARAMMKEVQPDLVIGCGGYVSGPVVRCAAKKGIKTAIHEQNAFPGVTNKILAKQVDLVFAAMPDAVQRLGAPDKTVVTGNPVREEMFRQDRPAARRALGAKEGQAVIISFGGSLGAQVLGERVADLAKWEIAQRDFLHVHATGSIEKADFAALAARLGIDHSPKFIIREYIDNMPEMLAAADLVISRSGAITISELAAAGRASIKDCIKYDSVENCIKKGIPSPNVAENHQYHNAMQLQKLGAAVVVEEKELTGEKLIGIVDKLSPPLRKFLSDNTEDGVLRAFMSTAKRIWPKEQHDQISKDNMLILVPAFTISELTKAFQVGFLLYLPFIAIDLIISNILLAMGMMMVSPMTISLPFKLLLFVTLDGWLKISQGLLLSYK